MYSCFLLNAGLSEIAIHVALLLPLLKDYAFLRVNAAAVSNTRPIKASNAAKC